jgi:hypothetical protein
MKLIPLPLALLTLAFWLTAGALSATAQSVPQTLFGSISDEAGPVPDGLVVEAYIDNTLCGTGQTEFTGDGDARVTAYAVDVFANGSVGGEKPGCGRDGDTARSRTGRPATTHILEIEPLDGVSLVRVSIATGRTHQIRVHLSEAGYPIVGDALYNGVRKLPPRLGVLRSIDGPCLHAARLRLSHPGTGERMTFEAPVPTAFATVIETLRRGAAGNAGNAGNTGSAGSADGLE